MASIRPRTTSRLPDHRLFPNRDGRSVWQPPILDYSMLIGEKYEKRQEATLKYYNNDVVRTTRYLDVEDELELLQSSGAWAYDNRLLDMVPEEDGSAHHTTHAYNERYEFFLGLRYAYEREVDTICSGEEIESHSLPKQDDGTWVMLERVTDTTNTPEERPEMHSTNIETEPRHHDELGAVSSRQATNFEKAQTAIYFREDTGARPLALYMLRASLHPSISYSNDESSSADHVN